MTFKFISLNMWLGGVLVDNAIEFLKSEKPDILAIQEANHTIIDILKKELNISQTTFAPAFAIKKDDNEVQSGNVVLSKFPIIASETTFYDVPYSAIDVHTVDYEQVPRNLLHVEVSINECIINIFNTQGIWGRDDKDNDRRLQMANTIVARVKGKQHVLLAGDLNVDQDSETIKIIEKEFQNIFKNELQTSFNSKHKRDGNFHDSVVDFIFASPSLKVIDHFCPQVDVSDHLPLVSVFEIR